MLQSFIRDTFFVKDLVHKQFPKSYYFMVEKVGRTAETTVEFNLFILWMREK
jgi:hypothetical protein